MKTKFTQLCAAFLFLSFGYDLLAQNDIKLNIYHALGDAAFGFNQNTESPGGESYRIDRLQYYISEISITHDGGLITEFDSVWILVNAGSATLETLGSANIDSVESVTFSIGVNNPYNNNVDPSSWPMSHALYHQNPSMHWGWASGYRFVALEGTGGSGIGQTFEVHALGNENYFETTTSVSAVAENGVVEVRIKGDYNKALIGLTVSSGFITHGSTGESITVLNNFRDSVFSANLNADTISEGPNGISLISEKTFLTIYSNPASSNIRLQANPSEFGGSLNLIDITGKLIDSKVVTGQTEVTFDNIIAGMYFVQYADRNYDIVQTEKIIVQ